MQFFTKCGTHKIENKICVVGYDAEIRNSKKPFDCSKGTVSWVKDIIYPKESLEFCKYLSEFSNEFEITSRQASGF